MLAIAYSCIAGAAMECGSQEVLCHVLTWVTENELAARKFNDLIVRLGEDARGGLKGVAGFLKDYGQMLVGLLGFSFGAWRWWLYHDRVLHKRLAEYISSRDLRLKDVREQALEAIQRPAPGQTLVAPSFVDRDLKSVLRENRWDNSAVALPLLSSADWQLSKAIEKLSGQLKIAEREAVSLRQELCTAFSLRGAVASATSTPERHLEALSHFRSALGLPGHSNDIQLLELEAHQLRKLGHYSMAADVYERVIILADALPSERDRDVAMARAKRYLAELEDSTLTAYQRMRAGLENGQFAPGPVALLEKWHPLSAWELLEKGDMHYFLAYLASCQGSWHNAVNANLVEALRAYESALLAIRKKRWQIGRSTSRLRRQIREGRERVERVHRSGIYDTDWLPPQLIKSNQPQQPAAKISATGSNQTIPETA